MVPCFTNDCRVQISDKCVSPIVLLHAWGGESMVLLLTRCNIFHLACCRFGETCSRSVKVRKKGVKILSQTLFFSFLTQILQLCFVCWEQDHEKTFKERPFESTISTIHRSSLSVTAAVDSEFGLSEHVWTRLPSDLVRQTSLFVAYWQL